MAAKDIQQISIKSDITYISLKAFEYKAAVNKHTKVYLKLLISEDVMKELERSPIVGKSIEINIQQNEVKTVYFIGYIDDAEWKKAEEIYVELHAVSFTKKMDIKKKKSSFQRIGIKYFKLIEQIVSAYHGQYLIQDGKDKQIQYPIIQYDETDWELIKRVAAHLDTVVSVNAESLKPRILLGLMGGNHYVLEEESAITYKQVKEDTCFEVKTYANYLVGDRIDLKNKTLSVLKKEASLNNGLIENRYLLGNKKHYVMSEKENSMLRGKAIRGTVVRVTVDRVYLHLQTDLSEKNDMNYAYLYLPVTGNVLYAMPEVGAEAELYFPTSHVKDAYVRRCFLSKNEYPHSFTKYLETPYKKSLELNTDTILWQALSVNRDYQGLELKNRTGIGLTSSKTISIFAKGDIKINANASNVAEAKSTVYVKQGNTDNSIEMSGNGIVMSADKYQVGAVNMPYERKPKDYKSFVKPNVTQSVLAALPMQTEDPLAIKLMASIPKIMSVNSLMHSGTGYYR